MKKRMFRVAMGLAFGLTFGFVWPSEVLAQTVENLPFGSDFSAADVWTVSNNETGKHVWMIGEDAKTNNTAGACMFTSWDESAFGYDKPYNITKTTSLSHAYVKVNIPADKKMVLTFRYFVGGDNDEHTNGYMQAGLYVGLFSEIPSKDHTAMADPTTYMESHTKTQTYSASALWKEAVVLFNGAEHSGEQYLVFTWYNHESSSNYNVYAAIDDVELKVDDCPAPSDLTVGDVTAHSIVYTWTAAEGVADMADYVYQIQKKSGNNEWEALSPNLTAQATSYTLSNIEENTAYGFRIRGYLSENSYSRWITAATTTTPYACPAPTNLSLNVEPDGDHVFTWQSTSLTQYVFEYRKVGDEQWIASGLNTSTYTVSQSQLSSATAYEARVRGVCAEGDAPNYTAILKFITPCGTYSLPYEEAFETWNTDGSLPCWTLFDKLGKTRTWNLKYTASSYDDRKGSCVKFNYNTKVGDRLISPPVKLSSVSELCYWAKSGYSEVKQNILISETLSEPSAFDTIKTITLPGNTPWSLQKLLIDEKYVGKTVYLAFEALSTSDMYIDSLSVKPYPAPTIAAAVTPTSAVLTLKPAATFYTVRYRAENSEEWTTLTQQSSPLTLSGLTSATSYKVQAKAHYAESHESEFSDTTTFITSGLLPYIQDFSTVEIGKIPQGWQRSGSGSAVWQVVDEAGVKSLRISNTSANITTLPLSLAGIDRDRLELIFSYKQKAYSSYLNMSISTDGVTWKALTGTGAPLGILNASNNPTKTDDTLALGSLVGEADMLMIRFEATYSYSSFTINLYGVRIQEKPRCLPPAAVRVVAETQTPTTTELAWSAPTEIPPTGYRLVYGKVASDLSEQDFTTTMIPASQLSTTLTGLQPNHTLYNVKMSSVCGEEDALVESDTVEMNFYTLYTCPKITDLYLLNLTDEMARLKIKYTATHAQYEMAYKKVADEEWTVQSASFATDTFSITALQGNTRYMVRLRVVCSESDQSVWDTLYFRTASALKSLPLYEHFDEAFVENAPATWQYQPLNVSTSELQWERSTQVKYKGEASLKHPGGRGDSALLVSPYLDLAPDQYYKLSFYLRREGYANGKTDGVGLWYNTAPTLTGGREIAFLKNHEDDVAYPSEVATGSQGERWNRFTFDSLTALEPGYLMLYAKGDVEQDKPFYIDEISFTCIYGFNIALQSVKAIPPRANMGEETVSVYLNNVGVTDFTGDVKLTYQINNALPVEREILNFTAENPLRPGVPYFYTFTTKADLSTKGTYSIKAFLEADHDPLLEDDTAAMQTISYEALTLPFETDFTPASPGGTYLYVMNVDTDDYAWILPPEQPNAMIYGRNKGELNDYLYTPGLKMDTGCYEVELTYAARQEGYEEKLSLGAYTHFTTKENALFILTDSTHSESEKTVKGEVKITETGVYMVGLHAWSNASRGMNVYRVSVKKINPVPVDTTPAVTPNKPLVVKDELYDTICDGVTYRFGGRVLTQAGRYTDTVRATETDTVYVLNLAVRFNPLPPVIRKEGTETKVVLIAETPEEKVQWYMDDSNRIYGAEAKRYEVTADGSYFATALGVCGESSASNRIEVKIPAAVEVVQRTAVLQLYPNPATDGRFYLRSKGSVEVLEGAMIYVYTAGGRWYWQQRWRGEEAVIDLGSSASGLYMIRVVTANGRTYNERVVLQQR